MKKISRKIIMLLALTVVFTLMPANMTETYAASKPGKVTITGVSGGTNSCCVSWKKVKGASKYQVFLNGVCKTEGSGTACSIGGLPGDTNYSVRVRAAKRYTKRVRFWYNKATGQYQKSKPAKKYRGKSKYFKESYYKYGNLSGIRYVYVTKRDQSIDGNNSYTSEVNNSFKINASAKTGLTYSSKDSAVAAVDSNGNVTCNEIGTTTITVSTPGNAYYRGASKSISVTVTAPPVAKGPTVTAIRAADITKVNIAWDAVNDVDGYALFRGTEKIYEGTKTNYVDTTKNSADYTVKCYKTINNKKVYGAAGTSSNVVSTSSIKIDTPVINVTNDNYRHITVSWNPIAGATSYEIYEAATKLTLRDKVDCEEPDDITSNTKYVMYSENLSASSHYFKVRAVKEVGSTKIYSDFSTTVSSKVMGSRYDRVQNGYIQIDWSGIPKEGTVLSAEKSGLDVDYTYQNGKWVSEKDELSCSYNVYEGTNKILENTKETSLIKKDVTNYQKYLYDVYACIGGTEIDWNWVANGDAFNVYTNFSITYVGDDTDNNNFTPTTEAVTDTDKFEISECTTNTATMSWNAVSYVDGYRVYRNGTKVYEGVNLSFTDDNLTAHTEYVYTVKAYVGQNESTGITATCKTKRGASNIKLTMNTVGFPCHEDWYLDYNINGDTSNTTRIAIGQVFDSSLNNKLNGGNGAISKLLTRKNGYNPNFSGKDYDLDVYCYDTKDFDNFLLLYVSNNVIVGWRTTAYNLGSLGEYDFTRGVKKSFISENHLNDGFEGAFALDPGLTVGAHMLSILSAGFTSYTVTRIDMLSREKQEELLAEYTINGLRVALGNEPMKHSDKIYGDGSTYGSKAYAITMAESEKVTHDTETLSKGPLAGQTFNERAKPLDDYYKNDSRKVWIIGEVATTAQSGEFAATAWFNSTMHRGLIMSPECIEFAVAGRNGYWGTMILANR